MISTTGPSAERHGRLRSGSETHQGIPGWWGSRSATHHKRKGQAGGFTLLELILVMLIICTTLGMASVSLRGFFASRRTADAAAQLVALTQYARSQAATEGRMYRVNLDTEAGKYWLTAQKGGTFETIPSEFGRVFLLPEGTTASWPDAVDAGPTGFIPFYPDGRTEAAAIRLTGRQGDTADVICLSPAERFHVILAAEGNTP